MLAGTVDETVPAFLFFGKEQGREG